MGAQGAAGHAGLFSNVPDLLRFAGEILDPGWKTASAAKQGQPFQRGHCRTLRSSGKGRRAVPGRWAGIRPLRIRRRAGISLRIPLGTWASAAAPLDRPGCRGCRCAADQPHLARPEEPADSRSSARFSRCRPRGALTNLGIIRLVARCERLENSLNLLILQIQLKLGDRRDAYQFDDAGNGRRPDKMTQE